MYAETLGGSFSTILVVDDNELVLGLVVKLLGAAQFRVLSAGNAQQAIQLAGDPELRIDLLISDIDMPQMNGPDLGQALKKDRPDLRVMLMSGLTDGNLLVLNYGWTFIEKPFVPQRSIQMVKDVPDPAQQVAEQP